MVVVINCFALYVQPFYVTMNTINEREKEKEMNISGTVVNVQVCEVKGHGVDARLCISSVVDNHLN